MIYPDSPQLDPDHTPRWFVVVLVLLLALCLIALSLQ